MTETRYDRFDIKAFMTNGKPATEFNEATEEIRRRNYAELIDKIYISRNRGLGKLANRFVGAEPI